MLDLLAYQYDSGRGARLPARHDATVGYLVLAGVGLGAAGVLAWLLATQGSDSDPLYAPSSIAAASTTPLGPRVVVPPAPQPIAGSLAGAAPMSGISTDIVSAFKAGRADTYDWSPVTVGPYTIQVMDEPLSVGGMRLPTSFDDAVALAVLLNAVPMTPALSDARWAQAARRIPGGAGIGEPAKYNDPDQVARWNAKYPNEGVFSDGAWKEPVVVPNLPVGRLAQYGFRNVDGSTVQKGYPGPHDDKYKDYSLTATYAKREATKDGQSVDLLDELEQQSPIGGPLPQWLLDKLRGDVA